MIADRKPNACMGYAGCGCGCVVRGLGAWHARPLPSALLPLQAEGGWQGYLLVNGTRICEDFQDTQLGDKYMGGFSREVGCNVTGSGVACEKEVCEADDADWMLSDGSTCRTYENAPEWCGVYGPDENAAGVSAKDACCFTCDAYEDTGGFLTLSHTPAVQCCLSLLWLPLAVSRAAVH